MKYLLYYIDGFIKKFPLNKSSIIVGRAAENDLFVQDETISRSHVEVEIGEKEIKLKDLGSTNGTYVNNSRVMKANIKIGESFSLGRMEFFLKKGTPGEFAPAKELIPIFNRINDDNENKFKSTQTRYITDIYNEILKQVLLNGMKKSNFNDFLPELSNYLSSLTYFGNLFMVSLHADDMNIHFSIKQKSNITRVFRSILEDNPEVFREEIESRPLPSIQGYFASYPFKVNDADTTLIYISNEKQKEPDPKVKKFLLALSKELALLSQLFSESKIDPKREDPPLDAGDGIIVGNNLMKELIKQTKKIAKSDIFILVQGESGTGKELFARLIYKNSGRRKKKFLAINCAAIPENLLEAELFGHEKGAFTGAYNQKKGKLEIASGGTLVLDEIGDMPFNLQSKLLRVLQEQEFYRLGGVTPIKVDLRIISLTNQNLKELIEQNKFRQDLYYRLVHHSINIPPLRERKEDISVLINFFTNKFCQLNNKTMNGYSIKAFEALQSYDWPGNVRQLENEINRVVNLTDDGERISYDILSEEVKFKEIGGGSTSEFAAFEAHESEEDFLLKMLEKNNWNKSKTARALDMTYQGLHKKMKRLGIEIPQTGVAD